MSIFVGYPMSQAAEERRRKEALEAAEIAALEAAAAAEADLMRAQRMKDAVAERVAAEKARLKVRARGCIFTPPWC